jgi:DNA mismatch repair protein MutS2
MSQRSRPHPEQHPATLAALEWPRLLDALRARLATDHGKEQLAALAPLTRPGAVRHALSLVSEVKTLRAGEGRLDFGGVRVLHPLLERAVRQGRLEVEELAAVLSTQRAALQLQAELRSAPALEGLQELAGVLHPLRELVGRLAEALTPAGALNESHYPELRRLRAELNARRDAIHARLEGLLRSSRLAAVFQDHLYTLRGRRYVLPVKADFRGQLPGIVHDVSASGHTLFVEPQAVVEDTNALTMGEKRLELETDRILRELSAHVGEADGGLRENLDWIGRLDLLHAQAVLSEDYRGTAPRVAQEGVLALKGLAHPLMLLEAPEVESASQPALESAAEPAAQPAGEPHGGRGGAAHPPSPVRNDLSLGGETRGLVISGANTGGKTVLLKAIGLSVLLVRHGMHVPAREGSRCDLFDAVWADIGDQQSLETSLSTFSAQIAFLADCLPRVGPGSLVLLDEMLTGTSPPTSGS